MPTNDGNNTGNNNTGSSASDILSSLLNNQTTSTNTQIQLLQSIDKSVKDILKNGSGMSQSNAMNRIPGSASQAFRRAGVGNTFSARHSAGSFMDEFESAFKREIMEAVLGSDFKSKMHGIMNSLAEDIGVSIEDIPKELGKHLAKKVISSNVGQAFKGKAAGALSSLANPLKNAYTSSRDRYWNANPNDRARVEGIKFANKWKQSQANAKSNSQPGSSNLANGIGANSMVVYAKQVTISKSNNLPRANNNSDNGATGSEASDVFNMTRDFLTDKFGKEAVDQLSESAIKDLIGTAGGSDLAAVTSKLGALFGEGAGAGGVAGELMGALGGSAGLTGALGEAGAAVAGLSSAAAVAAPYILAAVAAFALLSPAIDGTVKLIKKSAEVANRVEKSRQERIKNEQERILADVKTLVEEPFNILRQAAEEMYNVWDSNLRTIAGTQGYNKDDLQTLIGNYAERLRSENLTKVVSAGSITENLTKVLESGLSGKVAEEFAYLATKLNAAIPTQDFFEYASTYSSIAANAIKNGASQSEAIAKANTELEGFASNVLYASREIAGGFTTGLKDAESLFTQSVQIAQASKTGDPTKISAVMTAVSAITGAIAPDLAQSMTDAIYKAATGGNSTEIVALRSLAGINASNTEFLKRLAEDPQSVFANLFNSLAEKQNMSPDAYMEVAEGLSSIFGVSSDAFARVDFAYLAQAISSMDASSDALMDNIDLLASGETTTTAEQLKMQQINEYMLEEGLSYVLDNAAARSIQEHMWQEQIALEMQEATYGVELQGAALEFLEGIRKTVDNVMTFLNPIGFLGKISSGIANLVSSAAEAKAQDADIKSLLELGKVGSGNATSLYQLTTRGVDLNVTPDLISQMGGVSAYNTVSSARKAATNLYTPWNTEFDLMSGKYGSRLDMLHLGATALGSALSSSKVSSAYNWGTIGKSANGLSASSSGGHEVLGISLLRAEAAAQHMSSANKATNSNIQNFLGSMESFLSEHKGDDNVSYEDWLKTSTRFGIADAASAMSDAGVTEESVKGQFEAFQTAQGIEQKQERERREDQFWIDTVTQLTSANSWLETIYMKQVEFFDDFVAFHEEFTAFGGEQSDSYFNQYTKAFKDYVMEWTNYYVKHTAYASAVGYSGKNYNQVWNQVKSAENKESRDVVYKLAEALTQNSIGFSDLLDPNVQTNVLLAEILQIVNAIMQQGNGASGVASLPESISGMALGVVNT